MWVKLDDLMPEHPKLAAAGPLAFALDVAGIAYSARHYTDGFVPAGAVAGLLDLSGIRGYGATGGDLLAVLLGRLVAVGRWEPEADGTGWWIHDYLSYNPSAEEVQETREQARVRAGRRRARAPEKSEPRRNGDAVREKSEESSAEVRANFAGSSVTPSPSPSLGSSPQSSTVTEEAEAGLVVEGRTEIQDEAVLTDRLTAALGLMADEDVKRREEGGDEPLRNRANYRTTCLKSRRDSSLDALRRLAEANPGWTARRLATRVMGDERGEVPFSVPDHVTSPTVNPDGQPVPTDVKAKLDKALRRAAPARVDEAKR